MRDGRLNFGIIGAGKVGPVFAAALAGAGHHLVGINAAGEAARDRVEAMLPRAPFREIDDIVRSSDLVIFAIPGSELPKLVAGLTETNTWRAGQIIAHTAPEHGYSVFTAALAQGVIPLALHPALVFTGTSIDVSRLHGATIAVTAQTTVLPIGQALAVEMGAEPVVIADEDRPAYAEALDAAHQFSKAVVLQAKDALREIGVTDPHLVVGAVVRSAVEEALGAPPPQDG